MCMSLQVLKTPVRAPQANAHCARLSLTGHRLPAAHRVVGSAHLGGMHHHYELEPIAALVLQESFEPEIVHPVSR